MGFLNSLFGNNKKRTSLQDTELGEFASLNNSGNNIIWEGQLKFLNEMISLFISGTSDQLDALEKISVLDIVRNEELLEPEIDEALRSQFEEADKEYSKWRNHFKLISISTINTETSITFEENESAYHFNVFFLNGKQTGISIDS